MDYLCWLRSRVRGCARARDSARVEVLGGDGDDGAARCGESEFGGASSTLAHRDLREWEFARAASYGSADLGEARRTGARSCVGVFVSRSCRPVMDGHATTDLATPGTVSHRRELGRAPGREAEPFGAIAPIHPRPPYPGRRVGKASGTPNHAFIRRLSTRLPCGGLTSAGVADAGPADGRPPEERDATIAAREQ